jgi:hypothetical protein
MSIANTGNTMRPSILVALESKYTRFSMIAASGSYRLARTDPHELTSKWPRQPHSEFEAERKDRECERCGRALGSRSRRVDISHPHE